MLGVESQHLEFHILKKKKFHQVILVYLDSREGDSRGGVGADHERHDGRAQSAKHVGKLQGRKINGHKLE